MTDLAITSVRIIDEYDGYDAPGDEVFGTEAVRINATTGYVTPANATTAGEAGFAGLATKGCTRVGEPVHIVRAGIVDVGNALSALNFGAKVYLSDTDGTLADAAGTVSVIVGEVVPMHTVSGADKALHIYGGQ